MRPAVRLDFQRRDGSGRNVIFWHDDPLSPGPSADFKLPEGRGIVGSLRLAPGDYEISGFLVGYSNRDIYPKNPFSIPFHVEAGRVTYLGEYTFATIYGENLFGMSVPAVPMITVADAHARDVPVFVSRNPGAAGLPVQVTVGDLKSLNLPFFPKEPPPWHH